MKRLSIILMLSALVFNFTSCENDESEDYDNSITINGSITIDGKTYNNPTFNMGTSMEVKGYTWLTDNPTAQIYYIGIYPETDLIDTGNGLGIHYYIVLEGSQPGTCGLTGNIMFHKNDQFVYGLESKSVQATITKVDQVGGFIEATFTGTFQNFDNNPTTFTVSGKIKAKRIAEPTKK